MRLEKIKLAGFKSFVDPTTVVFPERLTGIVGPNGCGKSNLIDAVRFVIGESSAKHLRGNAMPDVIFNGSNTRKPVGLASVELIFDNCDGRLQGEYASFTQISLKRELSRDGESRYFLNGTRCRRRDVLDVLLGTGLGPRSYAIIEQGMIAHLIEAKPEELRLFLEEAAGLSKYKERRHETELKLEHVRANLQRIEDLRRELKKQVERLAKQAKQAEKYRQLSHAIQQCLKELIAIQCRQAEREYHTTQAQVSELENALAANQAALTQAEQATFDFRAKVQELNQQLQVKQAELYELNAAISQCDQRLRYAQKTHAERERSWQAWRAELIHSQNVIAEIQSQLLALEQERGQLEQELKRCQLQLSQAQSQRHAAQARWQEVKQAFDREHETLKQHQSKLELLKAEICHLERHLAQTDARHHQLIQERAQVEQALSAINIASLREQLTALRATHQQQLEAIAASTKTIEHQHVQKQASERRLKALENEHSRLQGKISALETLQRQALGKDRSRLNAWLQALGFQDALRLAEVLEIEAGWEMVVESALSEWLEAIWIDDPAPLLEAASSLQDQAAFISYLDLPDPAPSAPDSLTSKIRSRFNLTPLLGGFRCIETLAEALARRAELAAHECWITPAGDQIGPMQIKLNRTQTSNPGILERQKHLRELYRELEVLEQKRQQEQYEFDQIISALAEAEQRLKALQAEERTNHTRLTQLAAELNAAQLRQAELHERLKRLDQETSSISTQRQMLQANLAEQTQALAQQTETVAAQAETLARLEQECALAQADFDQLEDELRRCLDANTRLQAALERNQHASQLMQQQRQRAESQAQQLAERLARAEAEQDASKAPIEQAQREMEALLACRIPAEKALAHLRTSLKQAEAELRDQTANWRRLQDLYDQTRGALEKARLAAEAARVRWQTALAQAKAEAVDLSAILTALPEDADLQPWQKQLEQLKAQQASLGDVNLAAIEEHRLHSERLRFLDKQCTDLETSLEMLAKAIRQIDRESQACLRTTFEAVDRYFRERFPLLFGGGEAWMELLGDNLLEAGVRIMARPPGKRNSSIHLLSGGEKALTAIALVFSFFELNPAPVCLLDEVDAPLDEANVGRFCQLLKSMSERVQFIFVTHNKITMEIADQLIGVTMSEPGVSRIVAVDLKQATEMAAA